MQMKRGWAWLMRSIGNRRIHSHKRRMEMHQLDVKVNSRKIRKIRHTRRWAGMIKLTALVLLIAGVAVSMRWVYQKIFFENSEFRLNRLAVVTDGALTESDIVRAARIRLGMNLMEINLVSVKERILELPMVETAAVTRELPDRLIIEVAERVPVAWLASPRHGIPPRSSANGFLIDKE
ncbi:MAG: FtsQ-type POTRA domain-containing protein, partial [Verrucomicrobiales bacterium]|nr:FtsQ-type POTRA domain-containing protein [Verrucomicrobiales bacterium]